MAYKKRFYKRMSATKRAYLAGIRKGKAIAHKKRYNRRRW